MIMKKIGVASAALVLCAGLPLQTIAMASENTQSYTTNKAENKLKGLQAENEDFFYDVSDYFSVVPGTSSSINRDKVTITPNLPRQSGGLWSNPDYKADLTKDFHLEADLYMGNDINGADGVAFVMQNDPLGTAAIGGEGEGIGVYSNNSSYIKNALAVEFDTYYNSSTKDHNVKPGREHIAITVPTGASVIDHHALNILPEDVYLEDGQSHPVSFDWDALTKTLTYKYLSYEGSYTVDDLQATFGGTEVIFGFTGSTGSQKNLQELTITNLQVNGISPVIKTELPAEVEASQVVSVKTTISNKTLDATNFMMKLHTQLDEKFDDNSMTNIRLTRNDGQAFSVSKDDLLNNNVELPFLDASSVFTLTYDVAVKADAAPKGTELKIISIGKVNGVNYTSEATTKLIYIGAKPVITASDISLKKGSTFDPLDGVSATDTEDGNVTSQVKVTANNVDTSKVGTYHVTYSVTDSDGNTTTKTITVTVTSTDAPTISATDKSVKKGTTFNPLTDVTASDLEDGNVTSSIQVTANDVNTSKVGTYHVTYSVTNSEGNTTTKTITVTVTSNDAPVISATDKTMKKGGAFNPLTGVSATDSEDGNVTSQVKVTANNVDTSKVGTYHVTYAVTDSDGNTTTKTITVTVTSNDAPVIEASDIVQRIHNTYDVKKAVTASDTEDGDITNKITVTANDVNTEKAGVYHVTYSVTDSDGNTTTKTIQVTILTNDAPVITTSDVYLKAGDTFNPLDGITASDLEDGDLTASIKIVSTTVNMKSEGLYAVVYSVTDSDGNTTTVT
ncbi:immunoglobulin-like domain-containing protein, partial [Listeria cornellensis]